MLVWAGGQLELALQERVPRAELDRALQRAVACEEAAEAAMRAASAELDEGLAEANREARAARAEATALRHALALVEQTLDPTRGGCGMASRLRGTRKSPTPPRATNARRGPAALATPPEASPAAGRGAGSRGLLDDEEAVVQALVTRLCSTRGCDAAVQVRRCGARNA
jgi:hypothetical protein